MNRHIQISSQLSSKQSTELRHYKATLRYLINRSRYDLLFKGVPNG